MALAALVACGGGDGGGTPTATVRSASVATTKYAAPAIVTINGTGLDSTLAVSSAGCKNFSLLSTAPYVSSSTTAYYQCTVSGAFTSSVSIKSNGTTVGTANFSVQPPQVTLAVNNSLGVNGNIVLTLMGDKAPITADNFLAYVNAKFYDGLIIHRVVPGFVVQGGGFGPTTSNGTLPAPKPTNPPIAYESTGGKNLVLTIAMARTPDLNSATSQFFINLADNPILDNPKDPYAVFGTVTAGADVIAAITTAPGIATDTGGQGPAGQFVPVPNVVITTAIQTQ